MTVLRRTALLAAVVAGAAAFGTTPAVAADSTATVTGTVTAGGRPLANVVVQLGDVEGITPPFFNVDATTRTRADGTYRFTAVPAGSYRVQFLPADATGGTSATGYGDLCRGGGARCAESGTDLQVRAGRTVSGVNARLTPAGVLTGRLTDARGRGVGGFDIYVYTGSNDQSDDSFSSPYRTTRSDVNGNWTAPQLTAGSYSLCFGQTAGGIAVNRGTPNPDGYLATCPSTRSSVTAGSTTVTNARLVAGGGVSGVVVNGAGYPVAGATVVFDNNRTQFGLPSTTTDANGRFRIGLLEPSAGTLTVIASAYADKDKPVTITSFTTTAAGRITLAPAG